LFVFNLVESINNKGRFIYFVPALLEELKIPFTGVSQDAMYQTSNKILSKTMFDLYNIPSPTMKLVNHNFKLENTFQPPYIIKSIWEHASIGLNDNSIIYNKHELDKYIKNITSENRTDFFIEEYIDGREFNITLLEVDNKVEILPPAEIVFNNYPENKPKIVNYDAKWNE